MIGADPQQLESAASQLRAAADELDSYTTGLTAALGGVLWLGQVAGRFLGSWSGSYRPRMVSTASFIRDAATVLDRNAAEQRAASDSNGDLARDPRDGGAAAEQASGTREAVPTHQIFDRDNMRSYIGTVPQGSGDPALNSAMNELMHGTNDARVSELIDEIAEIRGVDPAELMVDYREFVMLRDGTHPHRDTGPINIVPTNREGYLGSLQSMRSGDIVGQALGIDPVFGALLNPTGGIAGPGDTGLNPPVPNAPLGYHAAFHDAGGFLYTTFGIGPGYKYAGGSRFLGPDDPLAGQVSGLRFWESQ